MAVRRRHGPSVSRLRRCGAHLLFGSGHAGVSKGPREHAQSHLGSESIAINILTMYYVNEPVFLLLIITMVISLLLDWIQPYGYYK